MKNIIFERLQKGKFVLIAEIGVNFYDIAKKLKLSNIDAAKLMIQKAREAGVHAVKFQSYKAEKLATKLSPSYWDLTEEPTISQFELFKKFDSFGFDEFKILSNFADEIGIEFLSTAFDFESVDYLYELLNVYKISSSDLNNLPFVEYQAKKQKPIIISTGASNEDEIDRTISLIRRINNQPLAVLHCVLEYPTPIKNANLNKIISLKNKYPNLYIGYSDHTKPDQNYDILTTAYNLGAQIIEKHFTLDKNIYGNDHFHSMDHMDSKKLIEKIDLINLIRGDYSLNYNPSELNSRLNARRSIVSKCFIEKGTKITPEMITFKRPGNGIPPSEMNKVIEKKPKNDIFADTTITYEMIE